MALRALRALRAGGFLGTQAAAGRAPVTLVWAVAAALLAPGCTIARYYSGVPLRAEPSALVEGESTKSDVLRLFGPPTNIEHQTNGDAFVYRNNQINYSALRLQDPITGIDWFIYTREHDERDTMVVLFDFMGVVRGVAVDHHIEAMPPL